MGGNVTAKMKNGETNKADKIPVQKVGKKVFVQKFTELFKKLNQKFYEKNNFYIWKDESILENGYAFNGSTSYVMDPKVTKLYKECIGDIDITVPECLKTELWTFLSDLEDIEIVPNIIYKGSNKPKITSIGEQINAVFQWTFNEKTINCQVDFEFLPYENNCPTEWSKFSHSSSIKDAEKNIKAVFHKFLIRSVVAATSKREDVIVCTQKSTPEKITISNNKRHTTPNLLKFSVAKGLRIAYEQLLDANDNPIYFDNKLVYKDVPSKSSDYITDLNEIFKKVFSKNCSQHCTKTELNNFWSFCGLLDLMNKYLSKEEILNTHDRFIELLWGFERGRAQELEANNPELDLEIKHKAYAYLIDKNNLKDKSEKYLDSYYKNYGK